MNFVRWFINIFGACKQMIFYPKRFWQDSVYLGFFKNPVYSFFAPLVFIAALSAFTREAINNAVTSSSIAKGLIIILTYTVWFYVAALTLSVLAKNLRNNPETKTSQKRKADVQQVAIQPHEEMHNRGVSLKKEINDGEESVIIPGKTSDREAVKSLLAYSMSPFLLTLIITGFLPELYIINIAGLYGFFIFSHGASALIDIKNASKSRYIILSILVIIIIFSLVEIVMTQIINRFLFYDT